MIYLYLYLVSCVVVYAYSAYNSPIKFKDVSKMDVVRGIIATLVWPITLSLMYLAGLLGRRL